MEQIYAISSASASTTYGNVMAYVKERLLQYFPLNFFKEVNLTSEIAYVNMRRRLGRNTLREMSKLERPFMYISPQIQIPNGDEYLFNIPLTKNYNNIEYGFDRTTLFYALKNPIEYYNLMYKLNRDRIQFDVTITLDTKIQQVDLYKYMVNHFTWERPFVERASLEAMVPREIIHQMGLLSGIDIYNDQTNWIPAIMNTLNRYGGYPFTYKIRNGTALDEFFMYYNTEILLEYTDLSMDDINRKGFADDFCQIRFNVSADFNLPGMFALTVDGLRPRSFSESIDVKSPNGVHDLIPLFTITNFFTRYPSERNGYMYYMYTRFQTDTEEKSTTEDTLDVGQLFDDQKLEVIRRYVENNIPVSTLVDCLLMRNGRELQYNKDWYVDWNSMTLHVLDSDDKATYCFVVYLNNQLIQEEIIDDRDTTAHDKDLPNRNY